MKHSRTTLYYFFREVKIRETIKIRLWNENQNFHRSGKNVNKEFRWTINLNQNFNKNDEYSFEK